MIHQIPAGHLAADLITLFSQCFYAQYRTRLVAGGAEPLYAPATQPGEPHRLIFRADYFASALHEIAHWCIAGATRRQQEDFGYWYHADGRSAEQQTAFERVEIKPQALEWIFSRAAGYDFNFSFDNLNGTAAMADQSAFKQAVHQQVLVYLAAQPGLRALPPRAVIFIRALQQHYSQPEMLGLDLFSKP